MKALDRSAVVAEAEVTRELEWPPESAVEMSGNPAYEMSLEEKLEGELNLARGERL